MYVESGETLQIFWNNCENPLIINLNLSVIVQKVEVTQLCLLKYLRTGACLEINDTILISHSNLKMMHD